VIQEKGAALLPARTLGLAPPFYNQVPENRLPLFTPKIDLIKDIRLDIPTQAEIHGLSTAGKTWLNT